MNVYVEEIFCSEIVKQCGFAIRSAELLEDSLQVYNKDHVWLHVQGLLVAVGNVSKIIWPSSPSSRARGVHLRAILEMSETSPLADRRFRNHFEHFDERLDHWAENSPPVFIDSNIKEGDPMKMIMGLPDGTVALRQFDPDAWAVLFMGERYDLRPVLEEIKRTREIAQKLTWEA